MTITLNGEPRQLDSASLTVAALLESLGLAGKPLVVELDLEPVLPAAYASTPLRDASRIELVMIAAGG